MTKFIKILSKNPNRVYFGIKNTSTEKAIVSFGEPKNNCTDKYRKAIEKRLKYPKKSSLYRQSDYQILMRNRGIVLRTHEQLDIGYDCIYTGDVYVFPGKGIVMQEEKRCNLME